MKLKAVSGIMLTLLFIGMLTLAFNIQPTKAELETTSEDEPSVEFVDFHNGTRLMIVDYGNGTKDYTTETFVRETAKLLVPAEEANQSLLTTLSTSLEESTEYMNTTQTLMIEQEVLLGFTYVIAKERYVLVDVWVLTAYARAGINVDIQCGLRLPINITMEYPEQMAVGANYTFYATLTPIDKPDFNELLFIFKAYIWVEAGIWVPFRWIRYNATYGPNIDESRSFQTPVGPEAEAPLPDIEVMVFDSAWVIEFSLLKVYLTIEPAFGSEKVTAKANAIGDARVVEGENLTWSTPNQRLSLTVNAGDHDPTTDYAKIQLSDFRYYFTILKLHVGLLFDFHSWIDWLTGDPRIRVATVDMSWLIKKLGTPYLPVHPGHPSSVSVTVYVERVIPPPEIIQPRDVTILYATAHPKAIYAGQILNTTVTVKNVGNVTESINVTIRLDTILIGIQSITEFEPYQETTLVFLLNTSGWSLGNYTLWAEVSTVPYEIDTTDNIFIVGTVEVIELEYTLIIYSSPIGVTFTVDGVFRTTPWSGTYSEGASVSLMMPETYSVGDAKYYWDQWSDGNTSRSRIVTMNTDIMLTAYFNGPYFQLTVTSSPITGITFTINGVLKTTPYTEWLLGGSYTLVMPQTHNGYVWSHWLEDGDTNRIRTITLQGTTWTAVYVPAPPPPPPVGGKATPINVTINKPESQTPWIWLTTIILPIVGTAIYVKRVKRERRSNETQHVR